MKKQQHPHAGPGFSLVELALAISLCAFCMVPLVGLIPVGLASGRSCIEMTAGAELAESIVADLKTTPIAASGSNSISPRLHIVVPGNANTTSIRHAIFFNEKREVAGELDSNANAASNPAYRATIEFTAPPTAGGNPTASHRTATTIRILITWPALADPDATQEPKKYSGSFETVISLDRS